MTIAICTYNRSELLSHCLGVLLPLVDGNNEVRVLVIDNNSTDSTPQTVQKLQLSFANLFYSFCPEQGLSHARNHALEHCQSQWLSFLDDDAYPDKNWLLESLRMIDSQKYDAFGGIYLPWYRDGKKIWFKDEYESDTKVMPAETEKRLLPSDSYFSGGSCCFNVNALSLAGGFPLVLGMNGGKMGYGEEIAAQRNMAIQGCSLGFSRNMVIYHYTPMHKQSIAWIWRRNYISGRDFWIIFAKKIDRKNIAFYLKFNLRKSLKRTYHAVSKLMDPKQKFGIYNFCYEIASWSALYGLIIGIFRYRQSQNN